MKCTAEAELRGHLLYPHLPLCPVFRGEPTMSGLWPVPLPCTPAVTAQVCPACGPSSLQPPAPLLASPHAPVHVQCSGPGHQAGTRPACARRGAGGPVPAGPCSSLGGAPGLNLRVPWGARSPRRQTSSCTPGAPKGQQERKAPGSSASARLTPLDRKGGGSPCGQRPPCGSWPAPTRGNKVAEASPGPETNIPPTAGQLRP